MSRSVMGALPARTHRTTGKSEDTGGFVPGLILGLCLCSAAAVLSLLAGTLIAYKSSDPDALIAPLGFGSLVLAALAGGLGVGLKCQSAVLPCALLLGCILLGLGLVAGLFFEAEAREALTLGLGLGASHGLRAGFVTLICAAAALTQQMKEKIQSQPKIKRR